MQPLLEVIAYCIEACQIATVAGADRIELCDNPGDGGTTPSIGMIRTALEMTPIPVFPIIRPRGGDFHYSEEEFRIMREDIVACRMAGCKGIVTGLLHPNGSVDVERTSRLVEAAAGMQVTFHRAFDRVRDHRQALEDVIHCGCTRILTSGLHPTASEGIHILSELTRLAGERITIMPGSGIRSANIADIASTTGARELHSSASSRKPSSMVFHNPLMRETLDHVVPDAKEVARMKSALQGHR